MRVAVGDVLRCLALDHALDRPPQNRRRRVDRSEAVVGVDRLTRRINGAFQLDQCVREMVAEVVTVECRHHLSLGWRSRHRQHQTDQQN